MSNFTNPSITKGPNSAPSGRLAAGTSRVLFVVLVSQLMVVLDGTIVNVALPHIQRSLNFSSSSLSWVLNAYILTFGGLLLLGARAGDLVGRRKTFLIGIALFTVSSLAGGFAVTSWMLLSARALQGVGAALAAPSSLALLTTSFAAGPARIRALGLFTTVSAGGGAIGLVAGGFLTELATWRWVMFVNVPIGVVVWIVGRSVLPETEPRHGRFDVTGALTSTLGVGALVLGLVEAGSAGWGNPLTSGSLLVGVALVGIFVLTERRASEPILPLRLLAGSSRNAANVARGLVYAGMYGVFFFLTQFLQDIQGYSPLRTGLSFLPIPASVFFWSQITSRVLVKKLPAKSLMLFGITLTTTSLLFATQIHAGASYLQILVSLLLLGAGTGISLVSLTSASLDGVAADDAGAASGLVNVVQQIGAALGLAVLVTVFGDATNHTQLLPNADATSVARVVQGLDLAFGVGAMIALSALVLVAKVIPSRRRALRFVVQEVDVLMESGPLSDELVLEGVA